MRCDGLQGYLGEPGSDRHRFACNAIYRIMKNHNAQLDTSLMLFFKMPYYQNHQVGIMSWAR